MRQTVFMAINEKTNKAVDGAKGQYAFADKETLKRSIGQRWAGVGVSYFIIEVDVFDILTICNYTEGAYIYKTSSKASDRQ